MNTTINQFNHPLMKQAGDFFFFDRGRGREIGRDEVGWKIKVQVGAKFCPRRLCRINDFL